MRVFPFRSPRDRARKRAMEWLQVADKVWHYRHDVMPEGPRETLRQQRQDLRRLLKDRSTDIDALRVACEDLEKTLRAAGGPYFPRNWATEYVEMIIVAAILAIGVRTYFFQPFSIPTNSMYPTYYGMTYEVMDPQAPLPSMPERVLDKALTFTSIRTLTAEATGVAVLESVQRRAARPNWPVFKGMVDVYTIRIGSHRQQVRVPADFTFRELFQETVAGRVVTAGESFLRFKILTGDKLFVDRLSYHFVRPRAGAPFVFSTDELPTIATSEHGKYYIKRLAGEPGDVLEIQPPVLLRNGEPADAAAAFVRNNQAEGAYGGYSIARNPRDTMGRPPLFPGDRPIEIPAENYFALGDNSDNSLDSRYWGFVPMRAIVGRAFFIYYPLTNRWGPTE